MDGYVSSAAVKTATIRTTREWVLREARLRSEPDRLAWTAVVPAGSIVQGVTGGPDDWRLLVLVDSPGGEIEHGRVAVTVAFMQPGDAFPTMSWGAVPHLLWNGGWVHCFLLDSESLLGGGTVHEHDLVPIASP